MLEHVVRHAVIDPVGPVALAEHRVEADGMEIDNLRKENARLKDLLAYKQAIKFRTLPAEVTDHTLTEEERLRVWIYIHRQRKEWDAKEKEMVAYRLVDLVGRASAANILGITVRELDKLVEIYELSEKLGNVREPGASITWAREIKNINRHVMPPSVLDVVVRKVNEKVITNSKDVRKLRTILKDPVARDEFLGAQGTIRSALEKLGAPPAARRKGLAGDIVGLIDSIKKHPWTDLVSAKGDEEIIRSIDEAEKLLRDLKKTLSK